MDDFPICAKVSLITDHTKFVLNTLEDLGLKVNIEKSVLKPSQKIDYLGYTIDTTGTFLVVKAQKALVTGIKRQTDTVSRQSSASARVILQKLQDCVFL